MKGSWNWMKGRSTSTQFRRVRVRIFLCIPDEGYVDSMLVSFEVLKVTIVTSFRGRLTNASHKFCESLCRWRFYVIIPRVKSGFRSLPPIVVTTQGSCKCQWKCQFWILSEIPMAISWPENCGGKIIYSLKIFHFIPIFPEWTKSPHHWKKLLEKEVRRDFTGRCWW